MKVNILVLISLFEVRSESLYLEIDDSQFCDVKDNVVIMPTKYYFSESPFQKEFSSESDYKVLPSKFELHKGLFFYETRKKNLQGPWRENKI